MEENNNNMMMKQQQQEGNKNMSNLTIIDNNNNNNNNNNNIFSTFDEISFGDILDIHDSYSSLLDLLQSQQQYNDPISYLAGWSSSVVDQRRPSLSSVHQQPPDPSPASSVLLPGESCEEVVNTPNTPNSISISSSSSDDHHLHVPTPTPETKGYDVHEKNAQLEDDNSDDDIQLKPKTKKQKRQKQPRFAFMTKSEIDNLEDGYRWRKYGQKAVKNSPFPRSYYRCTTPACGVKKRVERSSSDQTIVVTTYEGQHTHPCPVMTRGGINLNIGMGTGMEMMFSNPSLDQCSTTSTAQSAFSSRDSATSSSLLHHQPHFQNQYFHFQNHQSFTSYLLNPTTTSSMSFIPGGNTTSTNSMIHDLNIQRHNLHQLKDDGLLQDMVPNQMRNEPTKEE